MNCDVVLVGKLNTKLVSDKFDMGQIASLKYTVKLIVGA